MGKMNSQLTIEQVNSLIGFQRRYRFLMSEINTLNEQIVFYQDVLMSMLNNLVACNKINMYSETNTNFMNILDELKEIKDIIDQVPNKIRLKDLKNKKLSELNLMIYQIYELLSKYSNHISSENFNYILEL